MKDLFPRAKEVGLANIRVWLPGGRQNGDEWVVRNPTRNDEHEGSFNINLRTGQWSDFADDAARGGDAVSLYAYLNRSALEAKASGKNYKNREGGIQAEAAREILETYDPTYFPGPNDRFDPPARKRNADDPWDGFTFVARGLTDPPKLDTSWYVDKFGAPEQTWEFTEARGGKIYHVMRVVRFRESGGKKNDRPFTLCSNGHETKWRAKAPEGDYRLWGADELEARPNDRVVLTEGQKAAAVLAPVLPGWVSVGWYGGVNAIDKQDWTPLTGREVWFPFDGDAPGRKALARITEIAAKHQILLRPVYPPLSVPKGWDLADAVEEGWTAERIEKHLLAERPALSLTDAEQHKFVDDPESYDLRILGFSGDQIVFYPYGQCRIVRIKPSSLNKAAMIGLQDKATWKALFPGENGIRWDDAQNQLIRMAERMPVFDANLVRGAGAWMESGELVLNDGEHIIRGGESVPLYRAKSRYVYERSKSIPYVKEKPLTTEQASRLLDLLSGIGWKRKRVDPLLVSGWALLAPMCGALKWRTHLWITGAAGSGKSWVMDNVIIEMVVSEFGVHGKGTSTAAGVRNEINGGALPFGMDEMESDNPRQEESIDQILRLFREGSSGDSNSATLHGAEGGSKHWNFTSMACFASIGARIRHLADRSRFVVVDMSIDRTVPQDVRAERFQKLEAMKREIITQSWSRGFVARTISIWPEVQRSIEVCVRAVASVLKSQRDGDRVGTLLGGAWMVSHDTAPTAAEAAGWIAGLGIEDLSTESSTAPDEQLCLEEIFSAKIDLDSSSTKRSVGMLIEHWYRNGGYLYALPSENQSEENLDTDEIKRSLEQHGIKLMGQTGRIYIAKNHPAVRRLLRDSVWGHTYSDVLSRLPYCAEASRSPARFAGVQKRFLDLDAAMIFDGVEARSDTD